ncbi:hypothetical protein [Streptomonospora salina]|uniref:Uncharacterized protein n=1 Tax=Streptomonospora salina TaxID=104205 RepID=A0A841EGQ2_9ACTN|nr:hypothetical protein [Streptomonospora salina]MBB6000203.1 hypothetical protein [Streptomonospora salina]
MDHLDEEALTRAGARERAALPAAEAAHLDACTPCRRRAAGDARLAEALRAAEPAPAVPPFDALVAPHLDAPPEPVPVPAVGAGRACRLTLAVALRQVGFVPRVLWAATLGGFAVLAAAVVLLPRSGEVVAAYLGPVSVGLVTLGAVAVCDPKRDPRRPELFATAVPPVAVWLARLTVVLGALLLSGSAVSVLAAALPGSGAQAGPLIGSWLAPALLGAGLTAFGAVWRSPGLGTALGAVSWGVSVVAIRGDLFGTAAGAAVAAVWDYDGVLVAVAGTALAAAARLATRPAQHPSG